MTQPPSRLGWIPLLLLGCAQSSTPAEGSPAGFPLAYAWSSCAPWDGPATTIVLTPTAPDSTGNVPRDVATIVLYVWKPLNELLGARLDLVAEENAGWAGSCYAEECERATAATIRFRPAHPDSALEGSLELEFPARGRVTGGFRATWAQRREFCG